MSGPTPYVLFPGTAREALGFYGEVFGCAVRLHTVGEFGRDDAPPDAIAHGYLEGGPVVLFGADATGEEPAVRTEGLLLTLLGTAPPAVLHAWFTRLADGGHVVDDLQQRPWGATDGRVVDRYGLAWLLGYEGAGPDS